jgi:adenylate cyclase
MPLKSVIESQTRLAARLGFLWSIILSLVYVCGLFDHAEELLLDRWQKLPSPAPANRELALVAIQHVPSDRPWPWPRLDYALILRGLAPQFPQSVVFEMLLHDRDARFSAYDTTFADQVEKTERVLFAAAILRPDDELPAPPNLETMATVSSLESLSPLGSFFWPVETFAAASPVGVCNLATEKNQFLREINLVFRFRDQLVPSLALQAVALRLSADLQQSNVVLGNQIILRDSVGQVLRRIPIDQEGRMRLRFRTPTPEVASVNYDDFLVAGDQAERGASSAVNLAKFKGKQVWVAATDPNAVPLLSTIQGSFPPVFIHLQATAQILNRDFIRPLPKALCIALFIISGVLLTTCFISSKYGASFISVILLISLIGIVAVVSFQWANVTFPLLTFSLHLIGVYGCGLAARHWDMRPTSPPDPQMPLNL